MTLNIKFRSTLHLDYTESRYEAIITCGEFVRNLCVNLCIDPDTHNGYTRNVIVRRRRKTVWADNEKDDGIQEDGLESEGWYIWKYNANRSLKTYSIENNEEIIIEELVDYGVIHEEYTRSELKRQSDQVSVFAPDVDSAIVNAIDCTS